MKKKPATITTVRDLAQTFTHDELEQCLNQAVSNQQNPCLMGDTSEEIVNVLAKAGFVKQLMEQGMPIQHAIRELGRRMRVLVGGHYER